jgi:glycosyltransferase involved in cell wall biosynthesis
MKPRIVFIERKYWKKDGLAFSIEKVFSEIASRLEGFSASFAKLPYGNGFSEIVRNLLFFRPPEADIYHITGQVHYIALLLPPERTVLTVHDIGFLHLRSGLRRFVLKKLFLDLPLRRLRYVTVVSKATRDEIISFLPGAESKLRLIENPLLEGFEGEIAAAFNARSPRILQVGITDNKNIPRLLEALEGIDCHLRIVGTPDAALKRVLAATSVPHEVVGGLTTREMREEYAAADIVSFCSTYEGFGLPILEAQAMRRPLVTSDLSPMREVAGGGALLVDPFDAGAIRGALLRLRDDPLARARLVEAGTENVRRFDPVRIVRDYEELYAEVMHQLK